MKNHIKQSDQYSYSDNKNWIIRFSCTNETHCGLEFEEYLEQKFQVFIYIFLECSTVAETEKSNNEEIIQSKNLGVLLPEKFFSISHFLSFTLLILIPECTLWSFLTIFQSIKHSLSIRPSLRKFPGVFEEMRTHQKFILL